MTSPEMTIYFAGEALILHADGVIFWPAQKTLIAADLHFEKSTFLARHGSFVPPYDTQDTIDRLESLMDYYQPKRLILLGDSFHDAQGWDRLDATLRMRILALVQRVSTCIWIEGNHDARLHSHPLGELSRLVSIGGLHFAHDTSIAIRPLIIGHYHPKAYAHLGARSAHGKCFIHSDTLLVIPSFGSYTGGLNIKHTAIQDLFGEQTPNVHLLYRGNIYRIMGCYTSEHGS